MNLIQILLPICDNQGRRFPAAMYHEVKRTLSERFQGLTAYSRAAAEGLWQRGKAVKKDDIVVYEVMSGAPNKKWWRNYRTELEKKFKQESIIIRVQKISLV
jgi:hypothetical protein